MFAVVLLLVVGNALATACTLLYQLFWYNNRIRHRFDKAITPSCTIIIPCKGTSPHFAENIRAFIRQDYPTYEVVFTLESNTDAACAVVNELAATQKNVRVVIAGLATAGGQKNHNLIAATNASTATEIYVFADSDIRPFPGWLRQIVLPLSRPEIMLSTGFRWLYALQSTLGPAVHFYMNAFLYNLYCTISLFGQVHAWGGTMDIRRADFERLRIGEKWQNLVVDDSSISEIVRQAGGKSVLVPPCITHTTETLPKTGEAVRWFERQMMFLKYYSTPLWVTAMPIIGVAFLAMIWTPLAFVLAHGNVHRAFELGAGAGIFLALGKYIFDYCYFLLGPIPKPLPLILAGPLLLFFFLLSCLRTLFTNVITWAGVRYYMNMSGIVRRVERPGK